MTETTGNGDRDTKLADKPTLLERLSAFLTREPEDREELLKLLHGSFERKLLTPTPSRSSKAHCRYPK